MGRFAVASAGLAAIFAALLAGTRTGPAEAVATPLPAARMVAPATGTREVAIFAGGCFWGVEAVFEHVRGVIDVRSGYAGGSAATANYKAVSAGTTQHAEAVRILFDPRVVAFTDLLRIHFAVAHDPTELNRQGPDVGLQYRSAVFPQSPAQNRLARAYIRQLGTSGVFGKPIATRVEQGNFLEAEAYHQDFMARNPAHPYIMIHDRPKLAELKRQFPKSFKK